MSDIEEILHETWTTDRTTVRSVENATIIAITPLGEGRNIFLRSAETDPH